MSPSSSFLLAFITEHNIIWYEISFWSVWVSNTDYVSSQPLAHPKSTGLWSRGGVWLERQPSCCVSTAQVWYQHHSGYKYKAMGKLILSQPHPIHQHLGYSEENVWFKPWSSLPIQMRHYAAKELKLGWKEINKKKNSCFTYCCGIWRKGILVCISKNPYVLYCIGHWTKYIENIR